MDNELRNGKKEMDQMHGNRPPIRERVSDSLDSLVGAKALAQQFHETYERLAPQFGYETKEETRQFQEDTPNGRLMIAVCQEILSTNKRIGG